MVVCVVLLIVVAFFVFLRTAAFDKEVQELVLPAISERLGRQIEVGSVEGSGFFRTAVEVVDVEVAGTSPDEPFATVGTIYVHFRPWRFIFSLGTAREVSKLEVRGAHVNVVRFPNGKWNIPIPQKRPPPKHPFHIDDIRLIDGSATVRDEQKGTRIEVERIEARGSDMDPVFTLEELTAEVLGGTLRADGAFDRSDLQNPTWRGDAWVQGIDLGKLPSKSKAVEGTLVANTHVSGSGMGPEALRSVDGTAHIELRDANWVHFTVGQEIEKALGKVIKSKKLQMVPSSEKAHTSLGQPTADLRIHKGWANLEKPVLFETPMGRMTMTGRVGLDQRLDLAGTVIVAPQFLTDLVGGKVHIPDPLPVHFRVEGTTSNPHVTDIDVGPFGEQLPGLLKQLEEKILSPFKKKKP